MLVQQKETEHMVNDLQKSKQAERDRLISNILQDEEYTNRIVENLLYLKDGPDPGLIEREKLEQEELLDKVNNKHRLCYFNINSHFFSYFLVTYKSM